MKISIIMPSYNQAAYVEAAINSALNQRDVSVELIFIDGGSTDGTLEKIADYRKHFTHFISEPDRGQSHALAKGFALATGRFLTWLNTDDLLLPGALSALVEAFSVTPERQWFLGNVVWIDAQDRILRARRGEPYRPFGPRSGLLTAAGPSAFFTRELYDKVGGVNQKLHYQMDTDLWWRFILAGEPFERLQYYTWALRLHPAAKVSGSMFRDERDPKSIATNAVRKLEDEHVTSISDDIKFKIGRRGRQFLSSAQRLMSFSYMRSLNETRAWRGRQVKDVFY